MREDLAGVPAAFVAARVERRGRQRPQSRRRVIAGRSQRVE